MIMHKRPLRRFRVAGAAVLRRPWSRTLLLTFLDGCAAAAAWFGAYLLRFNFELSDSELSGATQAALWSLPLQLLILAFFGVNRRMWRYSGIRDLKALATAVLLCAVAVAAGVLMLRLPQVPRSVLLLDPILLFLALGGLRVGFRILVEHQSFRLSRLDAKPLLVLGAGDAGSRLVRALEGSAEWTIAGLLDDDATKTGQRILGVRVVGRIGDISDQADATGARHAVIAMPTAPPMERRRVADLASDAGLSVLTVPAFDDLVSGRVSISEIRRVEVEDLLGRDPVKLDSIAARDFLAGRTVLITGAGGSIGSELCRQIARFAPSSLVLFELSEFALYEMEQELSRTFPHIARVCLIGDAKNASRVNAIFAEFRPDIVFHAAAYKHVPLMEDANAWEAVRNNTLGTYVVASAAAKHGAKEFVLVSTDKAVNPTNVMGVSKRLAEMVCLTFQRQSPTKYVVVRFGNVLGSAGSVIPKFKRQIAHGGPVTITHPEMTRYFMSIPEAAQLVVQAGVMSKGGEIFVLEMGEPVKIVDLARELIRLSGLSESEVPIVFTGLRAGEKLFEELLADDETTVATTHPKVRVARARQGADDLWLRRLLVWLEAREIPPNAQLSESLRALVPEYRSAEFAPDSAPLTERAWSPGNVEM